MLPARRRYVSLLSPLARVDMQPGILDHRSNNLRTWQWWWEWAVTLIPVLRYLGVSTSCLYWQEKRYNLIFCFGNWVWPVLLSNYIPVIHTSGGSLVLPVSVSVMWWEMFRHALLWKMIWRSPRIWRIWHIKDDLKLNFGPNWGCLCRIQQPTDVSVSEKVNLKWTYSTWGIMKTV